MFVTKLRLFSIRNLVVPIPMRLEQLVNLIALASLNLVEHVYVHVEFVSILHVLSYILVKSISILHVQIIILPDTFKQHLLETFLQLEVGEMEIDETLA